MADQSNSKANKFMQAGGFKKNPDAAPLATPTPDPSSKPSSEDGLAAHLSNIWDKLYGRKPLAGEVTDEAQSILNKKKKPGQNSDQGPSEESNQ